MAQRRAGGWERETYGVAVTRVVRGARVRVRLVVVAAVVAVVSALVVVTILVRQVEGVVRCVHCGLRSTIDDVLRSRG